MCPNQSAFRAKMDSITCSLKAQVLLPILFLSCDYHHASNIAPNDSVSTLPLFVGAPLVSTSPTVV